MKRGEIVWVRNDVPFAQTPVRYARSYWHRMRGLLGRAPLGQTEGLVIMPCNAIHTLFMGYPIDTVFVDRAHKVVALATVAPWRARRCGKARYVVEMAGGAAIRLGLKPGDLCQLQ